MPFKEEATQACEELDKEHRATGDAMYGLNAAGEQVVGHLCTEMRTLQRQLAEVTAIKDELLEALEFVMHGLEKFKSIDKDNMEFDGRVTCYQIDKARAAIAKAKEHGK